MVHADMAGITPLAFGTLYEYDISSNLLVVRYFFDTPGMGTPGNSIVISSTNKVYGLLSSGIYEFDLNNSSFQQKYTFGSQVTDGASHEGLMIASNGKLYGVAPFGGPGIGSGYPGNGLIYEFDPILNTFNKKFEFANVYTSGSNPHAILVQTSGNTLYGTTGEDYQTTRAGTIFQFDIGSNILTKKFAFSHSSTGRGPQNSVVKHSNGRFYGITSLGGDWNTGTWFGLDLNVSPPTPILDFFSHSLDVGYIQAGGIGSYPENGFTVGSDGKFYAVTSKGSQNGFGAIYRVSPGVDLTSTSTTLMYSFTFDHSVTGAQCGLVLASNGKMYGMTSKGGTNNVGTIYEYNGGIVTTLFNFASVASGDTPFGNLMQATNGKLYGMTYSGGANSNGVIFEFDPVTLVYTKKLDFSSAASGANPRGNLFQASNGKLYGMTSLGGATNQGVLFEYDITLSTFTKKLDFSTSTGTNPYGSLMQSPNGKLYGTTYTGGANNLGVLFEYDPVTSTYTKKLEYNGTNGANPVGSLYYDQLPKIVQTITFIPNLTKQLNDAPFTIATASSGLPVSLTSSNPSVATVSGNMVTPVGVGVTYITASQAGDATYYPAVSSMRLLTINPSSFAVTPSNTSICLGNSTILTASGAISYSWSPAAGLSATTGSSVTANPRSTTTYTVTGTYPNGILASVTTTVKVTTPFEAGGNNAFILQCGNCGGGMTGNGSNTTGQLGDGTTTQRNSPTVLNLTSVIEAAIGTVHSLFLKNDGTVWAVGRNNFGQLGDGTFSDRLTPVQVNNLTGIVGISAGSSHSIFLKNDGSVWACGDGPQLGLGLVSNINLPTQITTLSGITKVSVGYTHSLFLKSNGTVWVCGKNDKGQLGIVSPDKYFPTEIPSLSGVLSISGGDKHSLFLKNDGTVLSCGLNLNGQLGLGGGGSVSTPTVVISLSGVSAISAGASHSIFVKNDGSVLTCGLNSSGQLGIGNLLQKSIPSLVSTLNGVIGISSGNSNSVFLKNDGSIWACGGNSSGQLGDGTTTQRPLPVLITNINPCGRVRASLVQQEIKEEITSEYKNLITVYPNPADSELIIELAEDAKEITPVMLFDSFGKTMIQGHFNSGEKTATLNTRELIPGMYFLRVNSRQGMIRRKVLVVH